MADESLHIPSDQNLDYHIVTLFERLEAIRKDNTGFGRNRNNLSSTIMQPKRSMHAEIRTLEFWRSIIAECLASFFYVFIVCGAAAGAGVGASVSSVLLATALASGFAIATLTQCFMHISGAHINPAVTLATCTIRAITPLRAAMYITAQCGGGIAGAALLYGVTVPGYQGNLQAAIAHSAALAAWERFGVEFILTFIVVLAYFVSMDSYKKYLGNASLAIGAAYSACSFVSMPYLNPARSLGPSFVLNKWDHHWVYWFGPMVGGAVSAIVYEYIFNSRRNLKKTKDNLENDSSSIHSEDDLNYDLDLEKPSSMQNPKFQGSTYRQPTGTLTQQAGYCQNFYTTTPMSKIEPSEPLYGGTRSLYCRSPPMPRANLNRSQSVYAKSNTAINRDVIPRPGPLVPAQSLYPMRLAQTQNSHLQNQNLQNQMQQRTESIYGIRGSTRQSSSGGGGGGTSSGVASGVSQHQQQQPHPHHQQQQHQQQQSQQPHSDNIGFQPVYGTRHNPTPHDGSVKFETRCNTLINSGTTSVDDSVLKYSTRSTRPESMYGTNGQRIRGQSAQSDDSSYGSYHGSAITPPSRNPSQTGGVGVGVGGGGGGGSSGGNGGNIGEIIMYAPPSTQTVGNMGHQQQQQQQSQIRTCERKISSSGNGNCQTGVGVNVGGERQPQTVTYSTKLSQQMVGQNVGQLPPPSHNQPPPPQQQQMQQQNQSAQYGMIPMRQN